MNVLRKMGLKGLPALAAILVLSGCMPRGGVINPGWTVVSTHESVVYAALASGQVVALNAAKAGDVLWTYPPAQASSGPSCGIARTSSGPTPLDAVYGAPVVQGETLLVSSFDGKLRAFDRQTGSQLWEYAVGEAIVGGVTVMDGVAYFGSADHKVYALDLATQKPVWAAPFVTGNRVWGAPAVDQQRVYIGSMDHYVYAVDRQTGAEVWRVDTGCSIPGSITLADGTLYVGGVDRRLRALQAQDGALRWQTDELAGWIWGEALVSDGYVYFGSLDGYVYGLSTADGKPRWEAPKLQGAVRAGPALHGDNLIVGTDAGRVYSINAASGIADVLYDQIQGSVLSRPAVDGDMVYVGSSVGIVYALDTTRRDPRAWVYPVSTK